MRWIIGDIHGMLRPLEALLDAIRKEDSRATLLFVGDYVNRGPESRGVVELLLKLPNARFCRGNHDDVFDVVLHAKSSAGAADPVPVFTWFMNHGLDTTLTSYGIDATALENVAHRPTPQRIKELLAGVPQSHRDFFRNLPLTIEDDDLFIVHAKWRGQDSDDAPPIAERVKGDVRLHHRVLWERFGEFELNEPKHWRRRGFFGHTPAINYGKADLHAPVVGKSMVLLDTGVALSPIGRLTAWCAETNRYLQVDHFARPVQTDLTTESQRTQR